MYFCTTRTRALYNIHIRLAANDLYRVVVIRHTANQYFVPKFVS